MSILKYIIRIAMSFCIFLIFVCVCVVLVFTIGCLKTKSWYEKYNWKAEDYFDDPKVILLCKAMESGDLEAIDKLIAEGVDVNAKGKKGMQPILWAYPAGEKVFEKILVRGGNPNFVASDTYGTKNAFRPDKTTLLYRALVDYYDPAFKSYVALLLRYGADPEEKNGRAIFFSLGMGHDNDEVIKQFIEAGINLNISYGDPNIRGNCEYLVTVATINRRHKALMILLEAGAEYRTDTLAGYNLHNLLYKRKTTDPIFNGEQEEYDKCIVWLEGRGVSFDKPAEKPEVFREVEEFRVNDKLLKWREVNAKRKKPD